MIPYRTEVAAHFAICLQSLENSERRNDEVELFPEFYVRYVRLPNFRGRMKLPLHKFPTAECEHGFRDIYSNDTAALLSQGNKNATRSQPISRTLACGEGIRC